MEFPIYIDTISTGPQIVCLKGPDEELSQNDVFLSLNVVLILANSADPDRIMLHFFTICQSTI